MNTVNTSQAAQVISAMIVDDELLAREGLLYRLEQVESIKVVSSCASAKEAQLVINECQPDVIFLDIEMPGMSGIELARWMQTHTNKACKIVFVTAFKEFALNAFEFEAFDYLLKPFSQERFASCLLKLEKAFTQHLQANEHQLLGKLLVSKTGTSMDSFMQTLEKAEPGKLNDAHKTISLKSGTQWMRVPVDSIFWIEAAGDYMCVHTQDGTHIIRKTLKELEAELSPAQFMRVNRSSIINLSKLKTLTPNSNGEYLALLTSGDNVKVTRKYKLQLGELNANI